MKIPKSKILFLLTFCFIFLIGINICLGATTTPAATENSAQKLKFTPEVAIPGFGTDKELDVDGALLGKVINKFYNYIVWLAGILAVIVIMIAGFQWVTAAGNQSKIGEAKERITGAIIGLVLALSSYMLLNIINPDLVKIQDLSDLIKPIVDDPYCQDGDEVVGMSGISFIVDNSDMEKATNCGEYYIYKGTKEFCKGSYCDFWLGFTCVNGTCRGGPRGGYGTSF